MNLSLDKYKKLSGSMLKLIAVISMLIDHTAVILHTELPFMTDVLFTAGKTNVTVYFIMRKLGRLAFPLFCFLISEGMAHTKNIKKYGLRLLLFAVVSEIPFNLMTHNDVFYPQKQNIYFTLFLGVLLLYFLNNTKNELVKFVLMSATAAAAVLLHFEYGLGGVVLILLMYTLKHAPSARFLLAYPLLSGNLATLSAFIPIGLYNGERGFIKSNALKFAFYWFYPVHILLLLGVKLLLKTYL